VAAVAMQVATATQFADFSKRVRPYVEIINRMEPNKRFFPLDLAVTDPASRLSIFHMIHGYAASRKQSYDPHLFDHPENPLGYRAERRLPAINWFQPTSFDTDAHGIYYDYIIVKGLSADKVRVGKSPKGPTVVKVHQAGDWRLYKVVDPLPAH
jgi:hypothetical protein